MSMPYDLAGASSKNRFRLEMIWGICKVFDLFDQSDFCVVFDYKCDIEIHFENSLEFYQLKTHKVQKPYSFSKIATRDKKTNKSVLGKLFILKHSAHDSKTNIKLAIVSNSFFQLGKKIYSDVEELKFSDLDPHTKKTIEDSLKIEFNESEVDISSLHYIYTSMNLLNPEDDLKGKIVGSFEKIKKCEPKKPNALYRLIRETVEEKACYELKSDTYENVINKKGITKCQLNNMLDRYVDIVDVGVEKTKNYIETIKNIKMRRKINLALIGILESLQISKELQQKEVEISDYLLQNLDLLPNSIEDITDELLSTFQEVFPMEYNEDDLLAFILLIIHRWEDGKYD